MKRANAFVALAVAATFLFIAVIAPRMLISGMRMPPLRTAAEAGLVRFEEVQFSPRDEEITLRAWWLPAEEPRGAVVLIHGGGANRTEGWSKLAELGRDLQSGRFSVLMYDMRNHGQSDSSSAGPTFGPGEANDVTGAIDFIESRAPSLPIGVIGFSMGGNVALYAAAHDRRIRAVVTTETFTDAASVLPAAVAASSGMPEWLAKIILWFLENLHGVPISRARGVDAAQSLEPGELLVIHNEADPIVPVGHAWLLAAAAPDAELWITAAPLPGKDAVAVAPPWGTHTKSYLLDPQEYVARVIAHLDKRLGSAPLPLPLQGRGQGG
jgi:pimeloyl-ACP methyl ester carboxylesterase